MLCNANIPHAFGDFSLSHYIPWLTRMIGYFERVSKKILKAFPYYMMVLSMETFFFSTFTKNHIPLLHFVTRNMYLRNMHSKNKVRLKILCILTLVIFGYNRTSFTKKILLTKQNYI